MKYRVIAFSPTGPLVAWSRANVEADEHRAAIEWACQDVEFDRDDDETTFDIFVTVEANPTKGARLYRNVRVRPRRLPNEVEIP